MYTSDFQKLPHSVQRLIEHGIQLTQPKKVILFGSRARGDFSEKSDYDVAFSQLQKEDGWSRFRVDYEEEPFTLQKVDLLVYEKCSKDYCSNIDREGILIYEY